jgi:hypothetical protein
VARVPTLLFLLAPLALPTPTLVLAASSVTGWQMSVDGPTEAVSPQVVQYHVSLYGLPSDVGAGLSKSLTLTVTVDGRYNGRDEAFLDGEKLSLVGSDGSCGEFESSPDGDVATCTMTGGRENDVRDVLLSGRLRLAYAITVRVELKTDNGLVLKTSKSTRLPGVAPIPDPGAVRCDESGCYDVGVDLPSRSGRN